MTLLHISAASAMVSIVLGTGHALQERQRQHGLLLPTTHALRSTVLSAELCTLLNYPLFSFHPPPPHCLLLPTKASAPPPTRTTRKWAQQSTAPAAGELAEDGSMAAPEQVGEMEGITPAPPQPPCSAAAPTPTSLPAFPPSSLAPTPSQTRPRVASMMTARPRSPSSTL